MSPTPKPPDGIKETVVDEKMVEPVAGKTPGKTPAKSRVSLGAVSNYYFKYLNSSTKKPKNGLDTSSILLDDENMTGTFSLTGIIDTGGNAPSTPFKNDTSMISMGQSSVASSSASSEDLLNKSTLSDTTELTASNFVLAATSRQKLRALAKETERLKTSESSNDVKNPTGADEAEEAPPRSKLETVNPPKDEATPSSMASTPMGGLSKESPGDSSRQSLSGGSPSLRSRVSASPGSLRQFTASLKASRMKRQEKREEDNKRRHSVDNDNHVSLLIQEKMAKRRESSASISRPRLPPSSMIAKKPEAVVDSKELVTAKIDISRDGSTTESMDAIKDLFQDLEKPNTSALDTTQDLAAESTATNTTPSPVKQLLEVDDPTTANDVVLGPKSIGTPTKSGTTQLPASSSSSTLDSASRSLRLRSALTPTKLPATPRRVINHTVVDSPARNTRSSAKKKKSSTLGEDNTAPMGSESVVVPLDVTRHVGATLKPSTPVLINEGVQPTSLSMSVDEEPASNDNETASFSDMALLFGDEQSPTAETDVLRPSLGGDNQQGGHEKTVSPSTMSVEVESSHATTSTSDLAIAGVKRSTSTEGNVLMSSSGSSAPNGHQNGQDKTASPPIKSVEVDSNHANETASVDDLALLFSEHSKPDEAEEASTPEVPSSEEVQQRDQEESLEKSPGGNSVKLHSATSRNEDTASIGDLDGLFPPALEAEKEDYDNDAISLGKTEEAADNANHPTSSSVKVTSEKSDWQSSVCLSPRANRHVNANIPTDNPPCTPPSSKRVGIDFSKITKSPLVLSLKKQSSSNFDASCPLKSPMRLKSNIEPNPRRVLNPLSPHSPARNTRSARKSRLSQDSAVDRLYKDEHDSPQSKSKRKLSHGEYDDSGDIEKQSSLSTKRRKSDVGIAKENNNVKSPMRPTRSNQSMSILSSKKRGRKSLVSVGSAQRSVVFGSPEAAEFRAGSPSGSFTPMPSSRAKALFSIPRPGISEGSVDSWMLSFNSEDETVEMETDIGALVGNLSASKMRESPQLSPIANSDGNTGNYLLPTSTSFTGKVGATTEPGITDTNASRRADDVTTELESGMDCLLKNTFKASSASPFVNDSLPAEVDVSVPNDAKIVGSEEETISPSLSVDMTDARSIVSMNSNTSDKFTTNFDFHAQKLNFSFQAGDDITLDSSHSRMDTRKGDTEELEKNMTSVLGSLITAVKTVAATPTSLDPGESNEIDEKESSDPSSPSDARQASVSHHTFTLSPSDNAEQPIQDTSMHSLRQRTSHQERAAPAQFTFDDLVGAGGWTAPIEWADTKQGSTKDTLCRVDESICDSGVSSLQNWSNFLEAVCVEVENRIDKDKSGLVSLSTIVDGNWSRFESLQLSLQDKDDNNIKQLLNTLLDKGYENVSLEWDTWLAAVLESFRGPIEDDCQDLLQEIERVNDASRNCGQSQQTGILFNTKCTKEARWRSYRRIQTVTNDLEREIDEIQAKITEHKTNISRSNREAAQFEQQTESLRQSGALIRESKELHPIVNSLQKDYASLLGLQSWAPICIDEKELSFVIRGATYRTSPLVAYDMLQEGHFGTKIDYSSSLTKKYVRSVKKYSRSIERLLDDFQGERTQKAQHLTIHSTAHIRAHVLDLSWALGRLDILGNELHYLVQRYKGELVSSGAEGVTLRVLFKSSASTVSVDFDVPSVYPSLPLAFKMKLTTGNADVESLSRTLKKNLKPGFGSLSRACDVLSSLMIC